MTIEVKASGQGVYSVSQDNRPVGRITNSGSGRWMFRRDDRAPDPGYAGIDVTHLLHTTSALIEVIGRELAEGATGP